MRTNRRIALHFTKPAYRLLWNIQTFLGCAILGSLFFMAWAMLHYYELARQIDLESNSLAHIRTAKHTFKETMTREGLTLSISDMDLLKKKIAFANRLEHKKSFSWATLLAELSEAIPTDTSIQSVHVKFKDSTILLTGKVKNLENLNALIENLQTHKMFRHAKISTHRVEDHKERLSLVGQTQQDSAMKQIYSIVKFTLSVAYDPRHLKSL